MHTLEKFLENRFVAYRNILRLLTQYPVVLTALLVASLLTALSEGLGVSLLIPLLEDPKAGVNMLSKIPLLGQFSDLVSDFGPGDRVRFVAVALVVITLFRGGFSYASRLLAFLYQIKVNQDLKEKIFNQLLEVELRFIHRERLGRLFTILNDYTSSAATLIRTMASAAVNLFTILIYAALMMLVSWQLTLLAMGMLYGVTVLIKKRYSAKHRRAGAKTNEATAWLNAIGLENLSALKLIHLFAQKQRTIKRYEDALQNFRKHMYTRSKLISLMHPLFNSLNAIILSFILIVSTFLFAGEDGSWISLILLFLVIMYRLMSPATALNTARAQVATLYPAMKNVLDFLKREDKPYLESGRLHQGAIEKGVALERVSFRYSHDEPSVINDVSFNIPQGRMTAVVGPSGAGKSTLIDLIARLYDPSEGRITVDGVDLRELDINSWRQKLAIVSQDTFIFNDSVKANIRFAKEDADDAQVQQAARLADAHEFITALPQGYDTMLGDRGVRLSGGQQQRIAIARAILVDPQLLILDEATSSLDSETERAIQDAIDQVSWGRTVLAIAHRLSTVRNAHNIVVIDRGRVIEEGTHDELMKRQGQYWRMVCMQTLEQAESVSQVPVEAAPMSPTKEQ